MTHRASRYHDISCGHRVVGHESKCRHLHGHNYRITFHCEAASLDDIGRVIDFTDIKTHLCMWIEDNWDHKFLAWCKDGLVRRIFDLSRIWNLENQVFLQEQHNTLNESIVWLPFNPTAENMAQYLVEVIGPRQLAETGIQLVSCIVEETRKCSASFSL